MILVGRIQGGGDLSVYIIDVINSLGEWFISNIDKLLFSVVIIIIGYVLHKVLSREITNLQAQKRLDEHLAYTLKRITKWIVILLVFSIILMQFGLTLGVLSGLLTILGGTIIGFAAINTIGNAIAGLIVMISRPFRVGDRIYFNDQFADIVTIDLIYTKMLTLDNVLVSIPNQELLKTEIDNYGKKRIIRRRCIVTVGFEYSSADIEKVLLEAASKVQGVLNEPKSYVWITKFQNYAVEYSLYVFISEIKRLPEIDADLHRNVLETCQKHEIDISTPLLLKQY